MKNISISQKELMRKLKKADELEELEVVLFIVKILNRLNGLCPMEELEIDEDSWVTYMKL